MPTLFTLLLIATTVATTTAEDFYAMVNIFRDTDYRKPLMMFVFSTSNSCYNTKCGGNDAISSVKWRGLPSGAKMVFYADADCKGDSKRYKATSGEIKSFVDEDFNDVISSFMVLKTSTKIEKGISDLCPTESAVFDGGSNSTIASHP